MITDWGDYGHFQPLSVSFLGFYAGGAFAWNVQGTKEFFAKSDKTAFIKLLNEDVFCDETGFLGKAFYEIGNVYLLSGENSHANGSFIGKIDVNNLCSRQIFTFWNWEIEKG
jgi:hexosaminidase